MARLHDGHLITLLCRIGWWWSLLLLRLLLWRRGRVLLLLLGIIHVVVDWWRLIVRCVKLVHLKSISRLGGSGSGRVCLGLGRLCLCSLGALFGCCFCLLLLLNSGSNRLINDGGFEVDRRDEGLGELLLRDKGVEFGLLRRPSFKRVNG